MGWAKHEDARAYVKSEYDRTTALIQRLVESDRGAAMIPKAIDDYLSACRLMGRQPDLKAIKVCLEKVRSRNRSLRWRTK